MQGTRNTFGGSSRQGSAIRLCSSPARDKNVSADLPTLVPTVTRCTTTRRAMFELEGGARLLSCGCTCAQKILLSHQPPNTRRQQYFRLGWTHGNHDGTTEAKPATFLLKKPFQSPVALAAAAQTEAIACRDYIRAGRRVRRTPQGICNTHQSQKKKGSTTDDGRKQGDRGKFKLSTGTGAPFAHLWAIPCRIKRTAAASFSPSSATWTMGDSSQLVTCTVAGRAGGGGAHAEKLGGCTRAEGWDHPSIRCRNGRDGEVRSTKQRQKEKRQKQCRAQRDGVTERTATA